MKPRFNGPILRRVVCSSESLSRTIEFYQGTLGLTLVDDDPRTLDVKTLDFRFADAANGETLRFVVGAQSQRGSRGRGRCDAIALSVPKNSFRYWHARLNANRVEVLGLAWAFKDEYLCFSDPDGLSLSMVEDKSGSGDQALHAIQKIHSLEIQPLSFLSMSYLLLDVLGFKRAGKSGDMVRFRKGLLVVDLLQTPDLSVGISGYGVVDELVWRASHAMPLETVASSLLQMGFKVVPNADQREVTTLNFREDGGTLFVLSGASRPDRSQVNHAA